jgi:putative ABC transport system substrate-binding protein
VTSRRALLRALGTATLIVGTRAASAQQPATMPRVAMLFFGSRESNVALGSVALFRRRLGELGYVDGKNVVIEERYAEGNTTRLNELARELAASKVDIIVAAAATAAAAARQATGTIPIVMVHASNVAGATSSGLIASLARPGGNVTGTTNLSLGGKNVELIRELLPRVAKLAVLVYPTNAGRPSILADINNAAHRFNISVVIVEVSRADDFERAFAALRSARADALLVVVDPLIFVNRAQVLDFAAGARLPASYDLGAMVRSGGLIAYAPVIIEHYAVAAGYVDKILKGTKPADLPVQQPTNFELVINLKTAKALGLTIPQSLLLRADEVIQ